MSAAGARVDPCGLDPRVRRSRAVVLAATLQLIGERGIAATTIEAVSERSGVARTTIYRHWDDQPALVMDAIASTLHEPPDPDTGRLRQDLIVLLAGLTRALQQSPTGVLMPALIEAAERDPAYAALHRREAAHRHRVVLTVITRGIIRGELPPGTDPQEVLDLVTGPVFYRRWVSVGTVDEAYPARIVDIVLAGYAGREGARPGFDASSRREGASP